jgi:uncharacterized protein (TIGR02145 family)
MKQYGSVTYEGQTYKTVEIGTQIWMARNLNYNAEGSKCYDDDPANCTTYGRLYDWATAMALPSNCNSNSCSSQINAKHKGVCPTGWHIPSDAEWTTLTNFVGDFAGIKLKSTSGWNEGVNGMDDYGFAALPVGFVGFNGNFVNVGISSYWWSATEYSAANAYSPFMAYNYANVSRFNYVKTGLFSVRCVKD